MTGSNATLKTSKADTYCADFVVLSYPRADYLINRREVASSLYCQEEDERQSTHQTVRVIEYNRTAYLFISLDEHLQRNYNETVPHGSGLILFAHGNSGGRVFPAVKRKSDNAVIDTSVIAVRSSGTAAMESMPVQGLRLLPHGIRKNLSRYGLLAVRFVPETGRVQYFLDLRKVIIMEIVQFHNRQAQNESARG